jgi:hypothetical protein
MARITANGLPVIDGELREQQSGAWTGRIEVDDDVGKITGAVTLVIGDATFVGTVVRGEVFQGRYVAQLVGGAGGLETVLDAKYYFAATRALVVSDALSGASEMIDDADTESSIMSATVARWMRAKGKARLALAEVAKDAGGFWRVTRAGKVALRTAETWETVTGKFDVIDNDPSDGEVVIAPEDTPLARPGVTIGGHKVAAVHTTFGPSGLRQVITVAADDGRARGLGASLAAAIKKASESSVAYSQCYPAKLVLQDADGSVHMTPDDERVRGQGLTKIPLVYGLPGCSAQIAPGSRARLVFDAGNAGQPMCTGWDEDADALELSLRAVQLKLSASGNPTQSFVLGELLLAALDAQTQAVIAALGTITPGPATGGGAPAAAALTAALPALKAAQLAALSLVIKGE